MPLITILGQAALPLLPSLLQFIKTTPAIETVLSDPLGYATRVGDLIVWHGANGQRILAGLQSLGESQARIEEAVTTIESAQIATNVALGSLHLFACANLGVTALVGSLMMLRLNALEKRLAKLEDVDRKVEAQNKAHLHKALQNMLEHDSNGKPDRLADARSEAQTATNIYGDLVLAEAGKSAPRLEILNYQSRCYTLSLLTELRARLLENDPIQVVSRFEWERRRMTELAKATFKATIGETLPELIDAKTAKFGVTLDLLTEVCQNARRWNAFEGKEIRNSSEMFEYARTLPRAFFTTGGDVLAKQLKYLIACFEDLGRIESLKLLAEKCRDTSMEFKELQAELRTWQENKTSVNPAESVYAYSFT